MEWLKGGRTLGVELRKASRGGLPDAVKAVWDPVLEPGDGDGRSADVGRVQDDQIAAIRSGPKDRGEEVAVALRRIVRARAEHRLRYSITAPERMNALLACLMIQVNELVSPREPKPRLPAERDKSWSG